MTVLTCEKNVIFRQKGYLWKIYIDTCWLFIKKNTAVYKWMLSKAKWSKVPKMSWFFLECDRVIHPKFKGKQSFLVSFRVYKYNLIIESC